jgi:hypothetical protein
MKRWRSGVGLVILCLILSALTACFGGPTVRVPSMPMTTPARLQGAGGKLVGFSRDRAAPILPERSDGGPSWMLPEALSEDLLYISNVYTVTVYSYPRGKHVGTLTGFYRAAGECSDQAGNVYVANEDTELEFRHGGTKPIKKLTLSGYLAVDCSVDPTTGNLAVTWNQTASSTNYIAIYKHSSGAPTLYSLKGDFVFYCGYDTAGNLFVDGQVGYGSQNVVFVELPSGEAKLKNITLNQSFQHVGAVQWDGKYVAVGDDVAQRIYRFAISGSTGTLEGTVDLGSAQNVFQWWIEGKTLIGPDGTQNTVWYWRYPSGGSPTKSIRKDVQAPYGATVSKAR